MATITENIQTLRSIKSDIKNAIIQKGGSVTDAFGTYAQAITDLPIGGGGGTEMEDALVSRTLSVYSNDRVSEVGDYAFANCFSLKNVNLQNCSFIGGYAFSNCSNLTQVYLNSVSNVTTIFSNTFSNCPNLTSVYVPSSLVNAFKTAQYWSSISDKIVAYIKPQISTEDIL